MAIDDVYSKSADYVPVMMICSRRDDDNYFG